MVVKPKLTSCSLAHMHSFRNYASEDVRLYSTIVENTQKWIGRTPMPKTIETQYGQVSVADEVIATSAGYAAMECEGSPQWRRDVRW